MTSPNSHNSDDNELEPLAIEDLYPPPTSGIDSDQEKGWFKRLLPILMAHRLAFLLATLCGVLGLTLQVSAPMILRQAIDLALTERTGHLETYIWLLIGVAAAAFLLRFAYRYLLFLAAYRVETDLRSLIYEHLTRLSFSFYDRVAGGEVISRANSDIRSIQLLLAFGPLAGLSMLSFAVAVVFMLSIHIQLTLLAVSTMPFVFILGQKMRDRVFPLSWLTQGRLAEVAMVVDENLKGTRVVKSFAAETDQITILAQAAQKLRWSATALVDARARFNPLIEALPRLGNAMILLYGGWLAIQGQIGIGALLAFSSYVIMIAAPFRMLGFVLLQAQRAAASSRRIFEILDEPPDVTDGVNSRHLKHPRGLIEFRDVQFSYPTADPEAPPVLKNLNLIIEPGETVALVGRTGCGKTTVARLLCRFYDVDHGAITIDGSDLRDLTLRSLRHHVIQVTDEPFLFSESIRNNVSFGRPTASLEEILKATSAAQAHDFVTGLKAGYEAVVGERGYTLSGGQRQRIALARALLSNPQILVLDDATSAVDVQVEEKIHTALQELLAERTTIVIAHRLSTITLANRVILIEDGNVVASGTHAELMETDHRYAAILTATDEDRSRTPSENRTS